MIPRCGNTWTCDSRLFTALYKIFIFLLPWQRVQKEQIRVEKKWRKRSFGLVESAEEELFSGPFLMFVLSIRARPRYLYKRYDDENKSASECVCVCASCSPGRPGRCAERQVISSPSLKPYDYSLAGSSWPGTWTVSWMLPRIPARSWSRADPLYITNPNPHPPDYHRLDILF